MTDSDAGISQAGRTDQARRHAPRLVDVGAPSRRPAMAESHAARDGGRRQGIPVPRGGSPNYRGQRVAHAKPGDVTGIEMSIRHFDQMQIELIHQLEVTIGFLDDGVDEECLAAVADSCWYRNPEKVLAEIIACPFR